MSKDQPARMVMLHDPFTLRRALSSAIVALRRRHSLVEFDLSKPKVAFDEFTEAQLRRIEIIEARMLEEQIALYRAACDLDER